MAAIRVVVKGKNLSHPSTQKLCGKESYKLASSFQPSRDPRVMLRTEREFTLLTSLLAAGPSWGEGNSDMYTSPSTVA